MEDLDRYKPAKVVSFIGYGSIVFWFVMLMVFLATGLPAVVLTFFFIVWASMSVGTVGGLIRRKKLYQAAVAKKEQEQKDKEELLQALRDATGKV